MWRIFQNSGLIIISLGLLFGGAAILRTQIPFWSLLYGIPAVFLGIVTSLISFNEIAKNRDAKSTEYHYLLCRVCDRRTLVPLLTASTVCPDCQYKMAVRLQMTALVLFAVVALPVTLHLTQIAQDIRQRAQMSLPTPICEAGRWIPEQCRCGAWNPDIICGESHRGRNCQGASYCCGERQAAITCILQSE